MQEMNKCKPQGKNCPICGEKLDIDTFIPEINKAKKEGIINEPIDPKPEDITFCFECRTVLMFNNSLNIVIPYDQTLNEVLLNPNFYRFVNTIDAARASKPNMN